MAFFRCGTGGGPSGYEIFITTEDSRLYGLTITIKKGTTTVGTTTFDNSGEATYNVEETGTYTVSVTFEGVVYSETVEVQAFEVELSAGFQYTKWLSYTDLDPTDYPTLASVLADEEAVRQLMTIHAAVDYLVDQQSTDTGVVTILNDNYAAKWISLTDYAMDTLEAAYGTLMGTIGKYGYGEWGITDATTTPPTWGALGNVPVMTSNTAPYGEAICSSYNSSSPAYLAFDGNNTTEWSNSNSKTSDPINEYVGYKFTNPVCAKRAKIRNYYNTTYGASSSQFKIEATNDPNGTWTTLYTGNIDTSASAYKDYEAEFDDNETYYLCYRVLITNHTHRNGNYFITSIQTFQLFGRTLKVSVPKMSGNTTPYGEAFADSSYSTNAPWKAFDDSASTMWEADDVNPAYGNTHIGYEFESNVVLVMATFKDSASSGGRGIKTLKYQGYDGENWVDITDVLTRSVTTADDNPYTTIIPEANRAPYKKYRMRILSGGSEYPSSNAMIYSMQFYGKDYSEREWDTSHPRRYLYDHGVEVETLTAYTESANAEKKPSELKFALTGTANSIAEFYAGAIDFTDYSLMRAAAGDTIIDLLIMRIVTATPYTASMHNNSSNYVATVTANASDGSLPENLSLDLSSVSGTYNAVIYVAVGSASGSYRTGTIKELWLE